MRCGCKSRGNANLYLCVRYQKDNFHALTFLLLAFHIADCCLLSSMNGFVSFLKTAKHFLQVYIRKHSQPVSQTEQNRTDPNKTQEHVSSGFFFLLYILVRFFYVKFWGFSPGIKAIFPGSGSRKLTWRSKKNIHTMKRKHTQMNRQITQRESELKLRN